MSRALLAIMFGATFWTGVPTAEAMEPIMPLDEIREGMKGELFTVVDSSREIKNFGVTILGIVRNGKSIPYIIARSEGAFADTDGGLMQGMSGSPVYVDGKLIGAGSATLKDMDPHTFLITPIEEMLAIWDMPDTKNTTRIKTIDFKKAAEERKKRAEQEGSTKKDDTKQDKEAETVKSEKGGKDAKKRFTSARENDSIKENSPKDEKPKDEVNPADKQRADKAGSESLKAQKPPKGLFVEVGEEPEYKSIVYASGFGNGSFSLLQKQLDPLGFQALPVGGSGVSYTTDYDAELYPGDAVGVALAYGDFTIAATGTVTATEEDGRVLAFGHSFLHRGNVNFFMTDASVFAMVNGVSNGMKFANGGSIIGRVNQDRAAGISGILGVFPSVIPIRLTVEDKSLGRNESYAATMAYDEAFMPILAPTIANAALERTIDQGAQNTVKVSFAIRTDALEDGVLERTNLFYAPAEVGKAAFGELTQALLLMAAETKSETDVYDIKVDISAEAERRTASLVSATPDKMKVKPGETVKFTVTIQPYRAEKQTMDMSFTVPKTQRDGVMTLDVHGGGLVSVEKLLAAAQAEAGIVTPDDPAAEKSLADRLKELLETDMNNEIVIEPGASPVLSEKEQNKMIKEILKRQEEEEESPVKESKAEKKKTSNAKITTDYVIDNVIHATIEVSSKAE